MTGEMLNPSVAAVIVGFDGGINYWKLMLAASYVQNRTVPFIGTNCDECFTRAGLVLPGMPCLLHLVVSLRFVCFFDLNICQILIKQRWTF